MKDQDLETLIRQMPLRSPPRQLDESVSDLVTIQWRPFRRCAWAASVALVGFALGYLTHAWLPERGTMAASPSVATRKPVDPALEAPGPPGPPGGVFAFEPKRIDLTMRRLVRRGPFLADQGPPVDAIHQQRIDRTVWIDPVRNITVEMTKPSERVIFVRQQPY